MRTENSVPALIAPTLTAWASSARMRFASVTSFAYSAPRRDSGAGSEARNSAAVIVFVMP
jgi:hypothetical protein